MHSSEVENHVPTYDDYWQEENNNNEAVLDK